MSIEMIPPNPRRLLIKCKRTMLIQKRDITGSETVIMHNPEATWGGDTCHAQGGGQPQSRRHSPTARSSQRHAPLATTARASQERKAEAKGGKGRAKVSRQELDKRKTRGQTGQCRKVTRWRQRMKFSVLGCVPKRNPVL